MNKIDTSNGPTVVTLPTIAKVGDTIKIPRNEHGRFIFNPKTHGFAWEWYNEIESYVAIYKEEEK